MSHPAKKQRLVDDEVIELRRELKALKQQQRRAELLVSLGLGLAKFSHEFRNALSPISIIAQTLNHFVRVGGISEETVRLIESDLTNAVDGATQLLSRIMDYTRSQQLDLKLVNLKPLIEEVIRPPFLVAHVPVQIETTLLGDLTLIADFEKLKSVFRNLLNNAIAALPQGGRIALRAQRIDELIRIEIEDTGVGFAEGVNLFQIWFTTKPGGTGFGLSIVREIILAHGGTISVNSEIGQGTTFFIDLPCAPSG